MLMPYIEKARAVMASLLLAMLLGLGILILSDIVPNSSVAHATSFACTDVTEIPQAECQALLAFYQETGGSYWLNQSGWLTTNTPCSWLGITCVDNHITMLLLPDNGLTGTLPTELGALTHLRILDLAENPPELSRRQIEAASSLPPHLSAEVKSVRNTISHIGSIVREGIVEEQVRAVDASLNISTTARFEQSSLDLSPVTSRSIPTTSEQDELSTYLRTRLQNESALGHPAPSAVPTKILGKQLNQQSRRFPELEKTLTMAPTSNGVNHLTGSIPSTLGNLRKLIWLDLAGNALTGTIPVEIGTLTGLIYVDLGENMLRGSLPIEIGNLTELTELYLSNNQLNGPIPSALGNLTNLTHLNLYANTLDGSIPPELGNLRRLQLLELGGNRLTGGIPSQLGQLVNLDALGLCVNGLSGPIPPELGNLANLTAFYLCYNQLEGDIPLELGGLSSIKQIRLDGNQLSGSIPAILGELKQLQILRLESNQLTGAIPPQLGNLTNLVVLMLFSNRLSGTIPPQLGNLQALWILGLGDNRLSGPIPPQLETLQNLTSFSVLVNRLSGPIPPQLGNLPNLQLLDLLDNELDGPIPSELVQLAGLTQLGLGNNQLTGSIPDGLGNLTQLTILMLMNNRLSGPIPASFGNLVNLERLHLYNNQLTGPIPPQLGQISHLTQLLLAYNQLEGVIPPELGNLNKLNTLWLGPNQLSGEIPINLGLLTNLEELWLMDNRLDGHIPSVLGGLTKLRKLRSNNNQLSGTIPVELENLAQLVELRLSNNRVEGQIPSELGALTELTILDLSRNQLRGAIPLELGNLINLNQLWLYENWLSDTIPPQLGELSNLRSLALDGNQLRGSIPVELTNLIRLNDLTLDVNQLSGSLPVELGKLNNLTELGLRANEFSGNIPPQLGDLSNLRLLRLDNNHLSGTIPPELGNLINSTELWLHENRLAGSIPLQLTELTNLQKLFLSHNRLNGTLPGELGNLINLVELDLSANHLSDVIPSELRLLKRLAFLNLGYNRLTTTDTDLLTFLAEKDPNWVSTQTLPPNALQARPQRHDAVALTWVPIAYTEDGGTYEVEVATIAEGPYTLHGRTVDKSTPGYSVDNLQPNTTYYFRVRTYTPLHQQQQSELWSAYTEVVSATTTVIVEGGDAFEMDDRCLDARALVANGQPNSHTFHLPGDEDWAELAVQGNVTYRVDVQVPADSQADVVARLFDGCQDTNPQEWNPAFSPGLQFSFEAEQNGIVYLQLAHTDPAVGGIDVAYQLTLRALDGETGNGAVILLAGRRKQSDEIQGNIDYVTQTLYQTLLNNGYAADDIYYLSSDLSQQGVNTTATNDNLHYAVTTWAKDKVNSKDGLTLYLIDHGARGLLYLDDVHGERLTPAELDEWLTRLESYTPHVPITVIIEACNSGSFITGVGSISKPGRVVITSTNMHNLAYASEKGAYFSDHLLTSLQGGHHLFSGFWEARIATRRVSLIQDPWLDADGDGIPNELDDAAVAARRTLFSATTPVTSTLLPPYIATVEKSGVKATNLDNGQRIRADVRDNQSIKRVWAVIYPPDYVPPINSDELTPEKVPTAELTQEGAYYVLDYAGFTQPGSYRVVVHAEDADGLRARPVALEVASLAATGGLEEESPLIYLPILYR